MMFRFECDCRYESRARVFLIMSIRERGEYRVEGNQITFTRATGTTTSWRYRFEGETLLLDESEEEVPYRQVRSRSCGG